MSSKNRALLGWALPFFFLTGITGLVYEVLWTRRLTLTFGHTVLAVSTVLTAYMAGLALGSLLGGRWTDRRWRTQTSAGFYFSTYGVLEIGIGLWALLSLPLLGLVETGYLYLAGQGVTGTTLHLACFVGSLAVLVPPTAAMGATLPVMTRVLVQVEGEVGPLLARLYGLNTLGAFVGAGLAGFVLFPWLGLSLSLAAAAALNLTLGTFAFLAGRSVREPGPDPTEPKAPPAHQPPRFLVPLAFGLTGSASMIYQLGWTRGLILSLGSSTYAFSAILAVFLAGLGLGSLFYPRLFRRAPTLRDLAWLQTGIAVTGALTIPALGMLPELLANLFPLVRDSFLKVLAVDLGIAAALLLVPALLMGLGFPLATQIYSSDLRLLGRDVGEVYSANTFGCIVGSFLGGFVLVPHLGVQDTLRLAVVVNLAVALALFLTSGLRRALAGVVAAVGAAVLLTLLPGWDTARMTAGVAIYSKGQDGGASFRSTLLAPAYYRDGLSASVSVHLLPDRHMALRVNGKTDASTGLPDMATQRLLGVLAAFVHPELRDVLVIGLGSGVTLDAVRTIPGVARVDCVELEPAVIEASRLWAGVTDRAVEDPRVRTWATDGRTFVMGSPRQYDALISEPSNPWIAGIGNLFTRDFYDSCIRRLKPGGVMVQWVQLYGLSERDLGLILHGFFDAFPHGMVWYTNQGDTVLLGSLQPLSFDLERARQLWRDPRFAARMFGIGLTRPEELAGHFTATREDVLARFGGSTFNTDDKPLLEFSAPLSMYDDSRGGANFELLQGLRKTPLPAGVPDTPQNRAASGVAGTNVGPAAASYQRLEGLPRTSYTETVRGRAFASEGRLAEARAAFGEALRLDPRNAAAAWFWGDLERAQENWPRAEELFRQALQDPPAGGEASLWLGLGLALQAQPGRADEAVQALERAANLTFSSRPLTEKGIVLYNAGRLDAAHEAFVAATQRDPADHDAWTGQGNSLMKLQRFAEALEAYRVARQLRPDHPETLINLGACYAQLGDAEGAREAFEAVLKVHPEHELARRNLEILGGR